MGTPISSIWVGDLYNFMEGDRFVNPGTNPAYLAGGFSMRTGLQGSEDVGTAISASDADMTAIKGRNTHTN